MCLRYVKHHNDLKTLAIWRFVNKLIENGWLPTDPWKNAPETMKNLMRNIERNNEFVRSMMDKYGTPV